MKSDSIFYTLFQHFPETLFQLIQLPEEEANNYQFQALEVKEASFRMDGVFIPLDEKSDIPLYFLEIQFRYDAKIYSRLFSEIFIYLNQNNPSQNWKAVLIFGSRKFAPKDTLPYLNLLNSNQVTVIYLDELPENYYNSPNLMILELIVVSQKKAEIKGKELLQKTQTMANSNIKENMLNLIETILLTKFSNLTKEEVKEMFALEDFKNTRLGKELSEEFREEFREKGRQEGSEIAQTKTIKALIYRNFSPEEIADILEISLEKVQEQT